MYLLLLLGLTSCDFRHRNAEEITIRGSDTEVNLVLELAENYMLTDSNVSIAVTGGGSGAGIASLINDRTDIANSSRAMKTEEVVLARDRGVRPVATAFAIDALAIIVAQEVPVDVLTLEEIAGIYRGEITNWSEVGGADRPISLYGRQSNSGTFVFFREEIVRGEYAKTVKQMNGTAQIVEAVRNDPAAIGYVGLGYVLNETGAVTPGVKIIDLRMPDGQTISPKAKEAILSGDYPVTRPLYQFTDGVPQGSMLDFLRYIWSSQGQRLVRQSGYYPLSDSLLTANYHTVGINMAGNE